MSQEVIDNCKVSIDRIEAEIEGLKTQIAQKKQDAKAKASEELEYIESSEGATLKAAEGDLNTKIDIEAKAAEALAAAKVELKKSKQDHKAADSAYKKAVSQHEKQAQTAQKALDSELAKAIKAKENEIKSLQKQIKVEEKAILATQAAE